MEFKMESKTFLDYAFVCSLEFLCYIGTMGNAMTKM